MRNLLFSFLLILFASGQSTAQSLGGEWGIGLGASIYQGDLNPNWYGAYDKPGFTFQVMAQQHIFSAVSLRASFTHGFIRDNEDHYTSGVHQLRNFSFQTPYNELAATLVINPFLNNGMEEPGSFRPYFFAGAGIAFVNITRDFSRFNRAYRFWQSWVLPGLTTDSLTALPKSILTFPVGFGLRYQIGDNVALFGEANKRITSTEYLDGFSKSANRKERDGFSSIVFGLSFRLGDNGDGSSLFGGGGIFGGGGGGLFGGSSRRNRGRTDCPKNVF